MGMAIRNLHKKPTYEIVFLQRFGTIQPCFFITYVYLEVAGVTSCRFADVQSKNMY